MADFAADVRDIKFTLFEHLGADKVFAAERYESFSRDDVEMILDEAYKFAREVLAPINGPGDKEGVHFDKATFAVTLPKGFKDAYTKFCENGWLGLGMSQEFGGGGVPASFGLAANEFFLGANMSFYLTALLTVGASHLIESFGNEEQKKTYCEKMYTGKFSGTMCLTESGAGSDVGASKTKAKKEGDHYLIEGEKIFITAGDHDFTQQKVHLVLARTDGAPKGTKGLSLFVVPKYRVNTDGSLGEFNDVVCSNIEHKMGIHASPTCTLVFGGNGNCHGWILGNECDGMKQMFQMMNEARVTVGLQGTATANAAYQAALAYARERLQGSEILKMKDPDAPKVPIINHADVRQMLLWQKAIGEGTRALLYLCAYYEDMAAISTGKDKEKYEGLSAILTPICKAYASDQGFRATELAVQTLGGYGYTQEYPCEQYLRDCKIASIYEGTNGIQALDLVGRKIGAKGGAHLMALAGEINGFVGKNKDHPTLAGDFKTLQAAVGALGDVSMFFAMNGMKDPMTPLLNATPYLAVFGDVVCGWLLLQQAVVAHTKLKDICAAKAVDAADGKAMARLCEEDDEARYCDGKVKTARFWSARVLALVPARVAVIKSGDKTPLEITF
ncbi:MAG: acyl-CoA dehydrogenase [Deltaproteobacteria bacterium]|nr:acyl-CoA dehydrogenase [Deltaproteobacteria bacterium]